MTITGDTFGNGFQRPIACAPKLIIAGFEPLDQSSHWFNELVSFQTEGGGLGLDVRIVVPRSTEARFAAALSAEPVLESLPAMDAENLITQLLTYADTAEILAPLWARLDAENLRQTDLLLFPRGHPLVIRGVGLWLAERPPEGRPNVFFRIIGDELTDVFTGRFKSRAYFYRLACSDLRTRPGQERVFFLVNSTAKARAVSRVCRRRPFMMPHHFGRVASKVFTSDPRPTIYVHLNTRSGRLAANLGDIIRRVGAIEPSVRFLVRVPVELAEVIAALEPKIASFVEILSADQTMADYLANLARCTMVLLAYEAQPYKALTSGVFTEAASLGKPIVVPAGTWMAQKIAAGDGVGRVFEDPAAECVAGVLLDALHASDQLGAAARDIAPRLGEETGCRRYIEKMIALTQVVADMESRYQLGDEIDFGDPLDSRCFMREGWGETEAWGVWTVRRHAGLALPVEAAPGERLVLNAYAHAFLGKAKERVCVRVSAAGQQIAEWIFDGGKVEISQPRWLTALLPSHDGQNPSRVADISFEIDAPKSPFAVGMSDDRRTLGLGLCKMSLTSAGSP